jgi:hypothetical protein
VEFVVPPLTLVGLRVREDSAGALIVSVADAAPPAATIFEVVLEDTGLVVTVKVTVVAPAATVTLAGTCAAVDRLELRLTTNPPEGACPLSVTVPTEFVPPVTEAGDRDTVRTCGGVTVRVVEAALVNVAVTVTTVDTLTGVVVMLNVVVVAPLAIVTLAGRPAAGLLLESVTTAPPVRAGPVSVTVPVEPAPPTTDVGLTVTDETCNGSTVSADDAVLPL